MNFVGTRTLITGASGFLGSWMTEKLHHAGADCVAMTGPRATSRWLKHFKNDIQQFHGDLTSLTVDTLTREIGQVDHVFHMAAVGVNQNESNIRAVADVNIGGTLTILKYAREIGARSVVVTGSGFEYPGRLMIDEATPPEPKSFYALCKAASSLATVAFAQTHDVPACVLRPFVVYGPREAGHRLVTQVCEATLAKRPVNITSGNQLRDWVYVDDAIEAHLRAALTPNAKGQIFNVASGAAVSVRQVAETICRLGGEDTDLLKFGAKEQRPHEIWEQSGDPEKARNQLGWSAKTTLTDGLEKTLAWYRDRNEP